MTWRKEHMVQTSEENNRQMPGPRYREGIAAIILMVIIGSQTLSVPRTEFALAAALHPPSRPGFGLDQYDRTQQLRDHPMAIALYASAHAVAYEASDARRWLDRARVAADELLEVVVEEDDDYGWGLGFPWDAAFDGSVNPVDTVYGTTTALAVNALLDLYRLTGEPQYGAAAERALMAYIPYRTADGWFWYSNSTADDYVVYSANSLLAGAYAKAGEQLDNAEFRQIARRTAQLLLDSMSMRSGKPSWPYWTRDSRTNSAVAAGYLAHGLFEVASTGGADIDTTPVAQFLQTYFGANGVSSRPHDRHPSELWGVGYALYVACRYMRDPKLVDAALSQIEDYRIGPGTFGVVPGRNDFFPRHQAHLLLGLAACTQPEQ